MRWLEANPPDPATDAVGVLTLDAMSWFALAEFHPVDATRLAAGEQLDRRLAAMPLPAESTMVALSYWSTVLEMMSIRGIDLTPQRSALAGWDLDALVDEAGPTTAFWIDVMLSSVGLREEPDRAGTLLATGATVPPAEYEPSVRDAYRLFHELVPLTRMARETVEGIDADQLDFARRVVGGLVEVSRREGDTDGVAEALVCSALLGVGGTDAYRGQLAWLLSRQREDGTFMASRDAGRNTTTDHYRHVVMASSWALLASVPFE